LRERRRAARFRRQHTVVVAHDAIEQRTTATLRVIFASTCAAAAANVAA